MKISDNTWIYPINCDSLSILIYICWYVYTVYLETAWSIGLDGTAMHVQSLFFQTSLYEKKHI